MDIKQLNKSHIPIVRLDKSLDKYKDKIVFNEKVEQANKVLANVGTPNPESEGEE